MNSTEFIAQGIAQAQARLDRTQVTNPVAIEILKTAGGYLTVAQEFSAACDYPRVSMLLAMAMTARDFAADLEETPDDAFLLAVAAPWKNGGAA